MAYGIGVGFFSGSTLSWYLCNKHFSKIFKTKTTENNMKIYHETLNIIEDINKLKKKIEIATKKLNS